MVITKATINGVLNNVESNPRVSKQIPEAEEPYGKNTYAIHALIRTLRDVQNTIRVAEEELKEYTTEVNRVQHVIEYQNQTFDQLEKVLQTLESE